MFRREMILGAAALGLAACTPVDSARIGPDGLPLPQVYNIKASDTGDIQFRMLDSVNTLRAAAGLSPVALDAELNAAAATHSRDMSAQNRPWLFGSDGSSPLDRARDFGCMDEPKRYTRRCASPKRNPYGFRMVPRTSGQIVVDNDDGR